MKSHLYADNSRILRWVGITLLGLIVGGSMLSVGILLVRLRSQLELNAQPAQATQGQGRH